MSPQLEVARVAAIRTAGLDFTETAVCVQRIHYMGAAYPLYVKAPSCWGLAA